ncbi:MAG TPA: phosphatidate cytidylyltransferase [Minicystis sp.]|nr:phosphatidate cytidylyltransferase [Minicystis sp.]
MAKSNLAVRFATAGVGAPAILALLYFGKPAWWLAFIAVAVAIGAAELFGMFCREDRVARALGVLLCEMALFGLWWGSRDWRVLLTYLFVAPTLAMCLVLLRLGDMKTAALRVAAFVFGPIYLGGGLGALVLLRRDAGADGPSFVVLALMLSWLSDTGAYFAGRFLGKHKLYEAVSPKKTVEGAIGGLGGAVVGALLAHFWYLRSLPLVDGLVLAVVAGGLGPAGALGESLMKRSVGVKDSGGIVPGHGGILDRVDALLVTGSITYLYVLWTRG